MYNYFTLKRTMVTLLDSYFDALFDINIPKEGLNGSDSRNVVHAFARNPGDAPGCTTGAAFATCAGFLAYALMKTIKL